MGSHEVELGQSKKDVFDEKAFHRRNGFGNVPRNLGSLAEDQRHSGH